jgi:DNA-binding transcriptional LysR family regulator
MERLDLRLVEYFVAVADELHFGRAAKRLHIAQPSLSQQIRRLERQLGVTLFERNSRNVHLTPAGKAFLREAKRTLRQAQRAVETARDAGRPRLRVGFYGSAGGDLLPEILRRFRDDNPPLDISLYELLLGDLDEVLDGKLDVAFTRLLPEQTELEVEIIAQEPRVLAVASTHPLAKRESVTFTDLRDERFITNPAVPNDGVPPRWLAEQRHHGLPGCVAAVTRSIQEILAQVASQAGVCLVPASVARHHSRPDVAFVPITDADPAVTSLVYRQGHKSAAFDTFLATAREIAGARTPDAALPMRQPQLTT